ncbi:MAG: PrsW family intramembrane metalloprotease [Thermoplasmata archaeon]|nr:PrsW family intramembrane metalloprotease [Thermoplasmata archaeon]
MGNVKKLPVSYLAIAFGLGAVAGFIAIWGEMGMMLNNFGIIFLEPTAITVFSAVIVAPLVEELAKPLGIYMIQGDEEPDLSLQNWVVLGAMGGLGFAVLENILYASNVLSFGTDVALGLLLLRFLLPLHMIASAITGLGFGLWVKTRKGIYFVICIFIAMLIHGLFNFAAIFVG